MLARLLYGVSRLTSFFPSHFPARRFTEVMMLVLPQNLIRFNEACQREIGWRGDGSHVPCLSISLNA